MTAIGDSVSHGDQGSAGDGSQRGDSAGDDSLRGDLANSQDSVNVVCNGEPASLIDITLIGSGFAGHEMETFATKVVIHNDDDQESASRPYVDLYRASHNYVVLAQIRRSQGPNHPPRI
ncbi:hypothetical protein ACFL6C_02940 [Myxococcota bacterium]